MNIFGEARFWLQEIVLQFSEQIKSAAKYIISSQVNCTQWPFLVFLWTDLL